jgi:hypothetical protein
MESIYLLLNIVHSDVTDSENISKFFIEILCDPKFL